MPTPLDLAAQLQAIASQLVAALSPPPPVVTVVPAGAALQPILDAAKPGDTLALAPGATYTGQLVLRNKATAPGGAAITITTQTTLSAGRMTPAAAAPLAKLTSGTTAPAIVTEAGAHDYALIGLEVFASPGLYPFGLISIGAGDATQTTLAQVPTNFLIDRCYIHGDPLTGAKRGVDLNGAHVTVTNCWISDVKGIGQDTQALGGVNGPGPFTITNNYLQAAGENILFGGADPTIPLLVPSDIIISGNYITKDPAWQSAKWSVKNVVELKNAQRVLIEGNVLEYCWVNGQTGYLLVLTVRNQNGKAPWSTLQNIEVRNNVLRHGNQAINILALDDILNSDGSPRSSVRMQNVSIHNNLIYDVGGTKFGGGSTHGVLINNGPFNLSLTHNTFAAPSVSVGVGLSIGASKMVATSLTLTDNILCEGSYGLTGDGSPIGTASWTACVDTASVFDANLIAKGSSGRKIPYPGPTTQVTPVTFDAAFAPTPTLTGNDGAPVGADISLIKALIPDLDLTK